MPEDDEDWEYTESTFKLDGGAMRLVIVPLLLTTAALAFGFWLWLTFAN